MLRAAALAAFLCLLAAAPASAAVPRNWLGVVADGPLTDPTADREAEWDLLARSGARSVRTSFRWPLAQPNGPGAFDFTASDRVVLAAASRGLGVVPVVESTPGWAAERPSDPASPPRDPADYARYLEALVARYGPRGTFWSEHPELRRRPIRDWQIWNEPNLTFHWSTQPFARPYVRLLRAARAALRRADPRARVILAGLPNRSWIALRQIYRAGGRGSFDAVAIHPYTARPRDVISLVRYARREMRRHRDRRLPIWISELSWPAAKGKVRRRVGIETNERGQARRLRRGLVRLALARRVYRIQRVYWYTWLSAEGGQDWAGWSGLRRLRGGEVVSAPALRVFRAVARRLRR
jgi:polysaccharide biosynthesis protein PslG